MRDIAQLLERWQLDLGDLRERMYRAPTPRERERWHAFWLLAQDWSASAVADALERDSHTIGIWTAALPERAGIDLANWNWKVVRRFVQERFGLSLSRSSCLNYLHG